MKFELSFLKEKDHLSLQVVFCKYSLSQILRLPGLLVTY